MSLRRNFDEDDRSPKRPKHDHQVEDFNLQCRRPENESELSTLYSGVVYHIQSYLSLKELLLLSRVCHHHRQVALGLVNPRGLHRKGKEVPFVTWDTVAQITERQREAQMQMEVLVASSSSSSPLDAFRDELPTLSRLVEIELAKLSEAPQSETELESFVAMTPAPDYGAPASARRYVVIDKANLHSKLLLSPIIGRHVLSLVLDGEYSISDLQMIALRLPHLQCLEMEDVPHWASGTSSSPWDRLSKQERLPANLRSLKFKYAPLKERQSGLSQRLLPALPECPLLEELDLSHVLPWYDLSPLLHLPNLARLSVGNINCRISQSILGGRSDLLDQSLVIRQLTRLKYLHMSSYDNLALCLPTNCEALQDLTLASHTGNIDFRVLADRVPHLRSIKLTKRLRLDCPFRMSDWILVDHSMLPRFQSLHTLQYSQRICGRIETLYTNAHGSLKGHIDHVISNLVQLRSLTHLDLSNFFTEKSNRGENVHKSYFESRRGRTKHDGGQGVDTPNASYDPDLPLYRLHSVFRLAAGLPQLLSLKLSHDSAYHLPSLAFLRHLPLLQSLSLRRAEFLPIESLSDLKHVSSTLSHLTLEHCFWLPARNSVDDVPGDVSVYLLHDILQQLRPSHPLTQAVTVKFRDHMKRPATALNNLFALSKPVKTESATLVFSPDSAQSSTSASSSSAASSSSQTNLVPAAIEPRFSSWYEIYRLPAPRDRVFRLRTVLEIARSHDENVEEDNLESHPQYEAFEKEAREQHQRYGYHLVFDSFSALMPLPTDANDFVLPLTFHLLPNLLSCNIRLDEPNIDATFSYDRLQVPRHRIYSRPCPYAPKQETDEDRKELRQKMRALYGLEPMDPSLEIEGFSYARFIPNKPDNTENHCDRVFPLFQK